MTDDSERVAAGTLIDGKYRVVRLLGRGAMGGVYEVENVKVRRSAALKLLSRTASEDVAQRFEAEAQAAGRAGSKRIVEVFDLGRTAEGQPYMVMELLEGETLRDELKRTRRMSPRRAVTLLVDVLLGLEAAHAAGIVHRDLKPENVWVLAEPPEPRPLTGEAPLVKILDFGVSRFTTGDAVAGRARTAEGTMVGTCWYMSPEQIRDARNADARADVYAVGVMLYELVSGNVPFPGGTLPELFFRILEEAAPDPRQSLSSFPDALATIALRALEKSPNDRFTTAAEMREHLVAFLEERPPLDLDLGPLERPAAHARTEPAPKSDGPSLELDVPAPTSPSAADTWRATLESPGRPMLAPPSSRPESGLSPPHPPVRETVPFPLVAKLPEPPPATPRAPVATPPSALELGPPSSSRVEDDAPLSGPPSGPGAPPSSGPVDSAPISLAIAPRRVVAPAPEVWPRGAVVVSALALAVIAISGAVGLLLRADVLGG